MQTKTQKTIINLLAIILFIAGFSYISNEDYKDAQIAQDHAAYVKALAKAEREERNREFNQLAFEAQRLTTYAGDIK